MKYNRVKFILLKQSLVLALFLLLCASKNDQHTENPFFTYNFGGLEKLSPRQQIDTLRSFGYQGLVLQMAKSEHVDNLPTFLSIDAAYPDFTIQAVFVRYNFADDPADKNRWRQVVDLIGDKGIALWFIFGKTEDGNTEQHVEGVLREVVAYATQKNVPVTLYPHSNCYYYSAEQALPVVKRINHPNLRLALHLCHELRVGNENRMDQVVQNVKDYISFVTISGADKEVDRTSLRSMDFSTIQPLNKGDYDLSVFLKELKNIRYKGPVGFINFIIDKKHSPAVYLPESLQECQLLKSKHLNYN